LFTAVLTEYQATAAKILKDLILLYMVLSTGFALFRGQKIVKKRDKTAIFAMFGVLHKKTPGWDDATQRFRPRAAPAR
jgi:hypothetical protein